jgi:hypothetical protein
MSHFDWAITKKFETLGTLPKIEAHMWLPMTGLHIIYIYESSTLAKAYGIKEWCYWEHLGELDGNTLETG